MNGHLQILIVDDDETLCEWLALWLREHGYGVDTASSGRDALEKIRFKPFAMCFVSLQLTGSMDGRQTMMEIRRLNPDASIVIITAYASVDTAITALKEGAQEYIVKPYHPEEVSLLVSRIVRAKSLQWENAILREKLTHNYDMDGAIGPDGPVLSTENSTLLTQPDNSQPWSFPPDASLQEMEKALIIATIARTHGNLKEAAAILGIDRSTIYNKIRRYDIPR
jgi:DNA-binding NtrC family response regulator